MRESSASTRGSSIWASSRPKRESIAALWRRSWPMLIVFIVCGSTPPIADELFGRKWQIITGAFTLVLWLVLRPWRFGLASAEERHQVRVVGTIGLAGLVFNYALYCI